MKPTLYFGIDEAKVDCPARYDTEEYRGIVHRMEQCVDMAELQRRFDASTKGWKP